MDSTGDINFDDDDDDDEMLDLFSFGADTSTPIESNDQPVIIDKPSIKSPSSNHPGTNATLSPINGSVTNPGNDDDNNSCASNDSFIELLENAQHNEISMLEDIGTIAITGEKENKGKNNKSEDSDMQEILDWLDDDDEKGSEILLRQEEELSFVQPPRPVSLKDSIPKQGPIPPRVQFDTLKDAVMSRESSKSDIRRLLEKEKFAVGPEIRPHLWSKIICEKTLEETLQSSLADSFQQWEQGYWQSNLLKDETLQQKRENLKVVDNASNDDVEEDKKQDEVSHQVSPMNRQEQQNEWLGKQSDCLAERILTVVKDGEDLQFYRKALQAILRNHFNTGSVTAESNSNEDDSYSMDPLIPPVVCAILSSGVPPPVACVMLSQIIPSFMPILALTTKERQETATILHRQFYLLACYHLPYLVLHLDKFMPGWHKCYPHGKIPQSWLISHLAGETDGAFMDAKWLLHLWDLILTTENNSLRFFLVIAILDRHAERLLVLTNDDLKEEFGRVLSFSWSLNSDPTDSVAAHLSEEDANNREAIEWVREWIDKATLLSKETPISVIRKLKVLEDEAVTNSLIARQDAKEEKLRLQQEAEEKAQQEAREAEREQKADEARARLTRARLVAFYRQYNPGKENNIDKIMKSYKGRYEVLDAKLRLKYGVGFNPALKPKPIIIINNKKIFSTMNTGFVQLKTKSKNKGHQCANSQPGGKKESAVVNVPASEVLSAVCWSKDANRIKLSKLHKDSKSVNSGNGSIPLKFYIADCRLEAATKEQGMLPTSVTFCPEIIADPKRIQEQEIFESLRGSVHICIMSEGYDALPELYGHKMTTELTELIKEEAERNSTCARYFLSKGFPFVSRMEGGFASAHAYLCREGPKNHLNVNDVLIEYDPEVSLFGRFEKLQSMSSRDKAQRSLQNMFDSSMTALTKIGRDDRKQQRQTSGSFRDTFAQKMQTRRDKKGNHSREFSSGSIISASSEVDGDDSSHSLLLHDSSQTKREEKTPTDMETNDSRDQQQEHKGLSGLGSRLKKPQDVPASPTKGLAGRRPFSRFGGLGIGQNMKRNETSATSGKPNNFAGSLKKFQMNTIARIRTADGASDESPDTNRTETTTADSILSNSSPASEIRKKDESSGTTSTTSASKSPSIVSKV